MINPKTIDLTQLPYVRLEDKKSLPESSGIYFVLDYQNNIQYIGRSVNLKKRWVGHHKQDILGEFNEAKIVYLSVNDDSLLPEIEQACIRHFDPSLNMFKHIQQSSPIFSGKSRIKIALREVRTAKGFSQNTLARALEMSLGNVQKIEYGKAKAIPFDTLDRLCKVLDCQPDDLLIYQPEEKK